MAVPGVVLGPQRGPFTGSLPSDLIGRYAAATRDPNPVCQAGLAVPPVAVVTQIWDAQQAGFAALVPDEVRRSMAGGVHGEHDVVLHRPVRPGEDLRTWVEGWGCARGGRHALVTLRYLTYSGDDELIAEQWWTTVLLDAEAEPAGQPPPGHAFPEAARDDPAGEYRVVVDEEMPTRYAEVSSDWSTHHFDDEFARTTGFQRRFLHGLCTMGLCAQGVVALVGEGDPGRVRRIAVRFASPLHVGDELVMHVYRAGPAAFAFEAEAGGGPVIRNGWVELRD